MFDASTKDIARRHWKFLLVDGPGSHLIRAFLKMSLAISPPHSKHTLQPLDVVMFKPLSSKYSKHLTTRTYKSKSLLLVEKNDFFPLFRQAWLSFFTKSHTLKSSKAASTYPLETTF